MTPTKQFINEQRRQADEFTKAAARILTQRGVHGGARPAALAWLLHFVQEDATTYSFGAFSDRWEEVKRFSVDGGLGPGEPPLSNQEAVLLQLPGRHANPFTATRSFPGPSEKDTLITLQQVIKGDINSYLNDGSATTFELRIKLKVAKNASSVMVQSNDLSIGFQYQVFHLLAEIGPQIRKCRRCRRLFLAGRKDREFCSGTCQAMMWKDEHPKDEHPPKTAKKKPKGKQLHKGVKRHAKR
jgi:hypothetical protein